MCISFSIIIPVKPGHSIHAVESLEILSNGYSYEIIISEGYSPSRQRNIAAQQAAGSILYFIDDDSLLPPTALIQCAAHFNDKSVAVVGGPSLTPFTDSPLQKLFGYALSSLFGAGSMRNRYQATGILRKSSQKELILCNMAIRRDLFLAMGGFDERLYPNEENELLDRIESKGLQILHDPDLAVQRSQRSTIGAFIRQMFNYGKGRAQQTKISRRFSIISFIPLFFVCYIFLLPIALLTQHQVWLLPILSYVAISLVFTVDAIINFRSPFACTLLLLYPIMHTANGFGLLFGLIFKVKNDSSGSMESPVFLRKSSVTKQMDFLRNNQTTEK